MPLQRRRRKTVAPAIVFFLSEKNAEGQRQLCVRTQCQYSDHRLSNPVWGHSEESVRRALAQLTQECDCPAKFHRADERRGRQILATKAKK